MMGETTIVCKTYVGKFVHTVNSAYSKNDGMCGYNNWLLVHASASFTASQLCYSIRHCGGKTHSTYLEKNMWFSNNWKIWKIEGLPTKYLSFFRGGFSMVWFNGASDKTVQCAYNIRKILSMFIVPGRHFQHIRSNSFPIFYTFHSALGFSKYVYIRQECDANIM